MCTSVYTTQHGAVLIIFPVYLQTTTDAQMLSIGGEGGIKALMSTREFMHWSHSFLIHLLTTGKGHC